VCALPRKYWKPIFGFIWLLLSLVPWILDQIGRLQTLTDLPIFSWISSRYFPPISFSVAVVALGWAYYDMMIRKQPAGFGLDLEKRSQIRTPTILTVSTIILVVVIVPILYHRFLGTGRPAEQKPAPASSADAETWKHGAKLEWGPFTPVSPPQEKTPFFFNVYMPNKGELDALNVRRSYVWRLTQKKGEVLASDEIDHGMSLARAGLMYPKSDEVLDRVATGDILTWFTVNDGYLTSTDFKNVASGHRRLYLWGVLEYRDTDSEPGTALFTEFCAYWEGSFSFYHSCDKYNSIFRGPRITALK
jgi:hypothetical protein